MSYVEAAFIPLNAYMALEEERLQGEELYIGELYVAMFALAKNAERREAAKLPLEVRDIAESDAGRHLASLAVLSEDRKQSVNCVGEFRNGYWTDVGQRMSITESSNQYLPIESYVRTYDPFIDSDLNIETESVELKFADLDGSLLPAFEAPLL